MNIDKHAFFFVVMFVSSWLDRSSTARLNLLLLRVLVFRHIDQFGFLDSIVLRTIYLSIMTVTARRVQASGLNIIHRHIVARLPKYRSCFPLSRSIYGMILVNLLRNLRLCVTNPGAILVASNHLMQLQFPLFL
ncbi:hypothetical protein ABKN59_006758 [Abortiporus biennis]